METWSTDSKSSVLVLRLQYLHALETLILTPWLSVSAALPFTQKFHMKVHSAKKKSTREGVKDLGSSLFFCFF